MEKQRRCFPRNSVDHRINYTTWKEPRYSCGEEQRHSQFVWRNISSELTTLLHSELRVVFQRHQRLMELDQNTWWETLGRLQRIIRKSAQVLFMTRKLNRDQLHNYFMSGTIGNVPGSHPICLHYPCPLCCTLSSLKPDPPFSSHDLVLNSKVLVSMAFSACFLFFWCCFVIYSIPHATPLVSHPAVTIAVDKALKKAYYIYISLLLHLPLFLPCFFFLFFFFLLN